MAVEAVWRDGSEQIRKTWLPVRFPRLAKKK